MLRRRRGDSISSRACPSCDRCTQCQAKQKCRFRSRRAQLRARTPAAARLHRATRAGTRVSQRRIFARKIPLSGAGTQTSRTTRTGSNDMSTLKRHQVSLPGGGTDLAASRRLSPLPLPLLLFSGEKKQKRNQTTNKFTEQNHGLNRLLRTTKQQAQSAASPGRAGVHGWGSERPHLPWA